MALWEPRVLKLILTFLFCCINSLSVNPSILGRGRAKSLTFELDFISLRSSEVWRFYYPTRGLLNLRLTCELIKSELFYSRPVWCPFPRALQFVGPSPGKWICPHWPLWLPWSEVRHSQWRTGHLKCNNAEAKNSKLHNGLQCTKVQNDKRPNK